MTRYREWELEQRELAAAASAAGGTAEKGTNKNKSFAFDLKHIELWAFIIGGIIVEFGTLLVIIE